jgi:hypothetical protein
MLIVVMLSVVVLYAVFLSVVMLNDVMLGVVVLVSGDSFSCTKKFSLYCYQNRSFKFFSLKIQIFTSSSSHSGNLASANYSSLRCHHQGLKK